ncbi:uncharacterized protein [Misgurnus anguillicaudatus]|uniref:uncharacterized protein isoform X2 n=1 Tax=Misgurnus anguillicaudatus TaxID=75329 RepID=UPI003CCF20CD
MNRPEEQILLDLIWERLRSRLEHALARMPVDLDFLEYICVQELVFLSAISPQVIIPVDIWEGLTGLHHAITLERQRNETHVVTAHFEQGSCGRPKAVIGCEYLTSLLEMNLPVRCIASLLGVSERTVHRRLAEFNLSVRSLYSSLTDSELDTLVSSIKSRMPNSGYRIVKGALKSEGHKVQYERVRASLHRVDTLGVLSRMTELGCVVRRRYSVPGPKSLMHIDTNHKLIRYNIVLFGGVDGFSRKIMYLGAATNNTALTALTFFQESVERYGFPLRIERLWRDVWTAVTSVYYNVLHYLEEDNYLNIADQTHPFCCHYTVLPRLQDDLNFFRDGWDNHPLRTEHNMSPNQLWELGQFHYPVDDPPNEEEMNIAEIDWESSGLPPDENVGVNVPTVQCPLTPEQLTALKETVDPRSPSQFYGIDIYMAAVQFCQALE